MAILVRDEGSIDGLQQLLLAHKPFARLCVLPVIAIVVASYCALALR
jgi:hypothetical protein